MMTREEKKEIRHRKRKEKGLRKEWRVGRGAARSLSTHCDNKKGLRGSPIVNSKKEQEGTARQSNIN
jgi:hypothetical protein